MDWIRAQFMNSPTGATQATIPGSTEAANYVIQQQINQGVSDAIAALGRALTGVETQWIIDQFTAGRSKADIYAEAGAYINQQVAGSHAGGLDFVPYDGYIAQLHKGERVLTASQAKGGDSEELVLELRALRAKVDQLMVENRRHTGDLIRSNYDANGKSAEHIAAATREIPKTQAWMERSKAVVK
jgi:hypothetical protein